MLYFAYGSNMDCRQMLDRCPSTRFVSKALLTGYRFDFTRKSTRWQAGVMDIVQDEEGEVWGVLYDVTDSELPRLDQAEGCRAGDPRSAYRRVDVKVLPENGASALAAFAYEVVDKHSTIAPAREYMERILAGARFWGLPAAYILALEAVRTA